MRPKTYTRKPSSRAACGKYHDEKDCQIKVARFSVGDGKEGQKRLAAIQYLYETGGSSDVGIWRPGMLRLAKQIAAGEPLTFWQPTPEDPAYYAKKVIGSQQRFPVLKELVTPDPELMQQAAGAAKEHVNQKISELATELDDDFWLEASQMTMPDKISNEYLHLKLRQYKKWRYDTSKVTHQTKMFNDGICDALLTYLPDCILYEFDLKRIEEFVNKICHRPNGMSQGYAEKLLTEFFKFTKWLKKNAVWTYPDGIDDIDRRVIRLNTDPVKNEISEDKHWQPEELRAIWKTANPMARLIIGLGINTGSGAAELGRMRVSHFLFDCHHPKQKQIKCDLKGSWYIGRRRKQFSHSEAYLWDWVADLVKVQIEVCKKYKWEYLFSSHGEPMYRDNEIYEELGLDLPNTTKPESRFVRCYNNAIDTAFKNKAITRKLSIGKLRKSFTDYLTIEDHEDLSSLLLSHDAPDDEAKNYTNRPYGRLHTAIAKHYDYWNLTTPVTKEFADIVVKCASSK